MPVKSKKQKEVWFIKLRGSYLPLNSNGWLTYIPYLAYLIVSAIFIFKDTSNKSIALFITIPNWVVASMVMSYIASRKS